MSSFNTDPLIGVALTKLEWMTLIKFMTQMGASPGYGAFKRLIDQVSENSLDHPESNDDYQSDADEYALDPD